MTSRLARLGAALALLVGCTAGTRGPVPTGGADGGGGPDAGIVARPDTGPLPPGPGTCTTGPGMDTDGDGFPDETDCNDCSAQVNPGAFDTPGNGVDEDCDGSDAAAVEACDMALPIEGIDPMNAARAMGLCRTSTESGPGWGVVSARYVRADGTGALDHATQVGVLPSFGVNTPFEGSSLFAISSGVARAPGQAGFTSDCDNFDVDDFFGFDAHGYPPGFPQESPSCPGVTSGEPFNSVALEVRIRVPTNALGFSFRSSFFTYEFPEYICDTYNDFFAVLRQNGGTWENIVFDTDGNAVSVNNSLLAACEAGSTGGKTFACPHGRAPLSGTGYDSTTVCGEEGSVPGGFGPDSPLEVGAGTGWLRTTAPVEGGSILTLRFSIWDSGDAWLDSLALIDGFEWELEEVEITETEPELI